MRPIILTGNTGFKLYNFRAGLIRKLLSEGYAVHVIAPCDEYSIRLEALGAVFHDLEMSRQGKNPFAELRAFFQLFMLLVNIRPCVVLSYTIKNNIYFGLACRVLKIPICPNVTGLGPVFNREELFQTFIRKLYKLAFARAHTVFFQNPDDLAMFKHRDLVDLGACVLLPGSGVDLEAFEFAPKKVEANSCRFVLVARMLEDKGVKLFYEAAKLVKGRHSCTEFILVGPVDEAASCSISEDELRAWERLGVVKYEGATDDVYSQLLGADCIVLPSWYREGLPKTLLEAAAVGRPIITTDTPGCREAVAEDENGFLCKPKSLASLVDALLRFCELSVHDRGRMQLASRNLAEEFFDEKIVIESYLTAISSSVSVAR